MFGEEPVYYWLLTFAITSFLHCILAAFIEMEVRILVRRTYDGKRPLNALLLSCKTEAAEMLRGKLTFRGRRLNFKGGGKYICLNTDY